MTLRFVPYNLVWKYNSLFNALFFDFSLRYSRISSPFLKIGPASSSFFLNFLMTPLTLHSLVLPAPWLFMELSHICPLFHSGIFKWISRKKTLLLNLRVTSKLVASMFLHMSASLLSVNLPLGVLMNHRAFLFINNFFRFRLLIIDVAKLKRVNGDIFYNWFLKFQLELNFSTFNFASLLDLLSVFFSTSSFVSTNSLNFYLTSDA